MQKKWIACTHLWFLQQRNCISKTQVIFLWRYTMALLILLSTSYIFRVNIFRSPCIQYFIWMTSTIYVTGSQIYSHLFVQHLRRHTTGVWTFLWTVLMLSYLRWIILPRLIKQSFTLPQLQKVKHRVVSVLSADTVQSKWQCRWKTRK